jgi:hypothetical protein
MRFSFQLRRRVLAVPTFAVVAVLALSGSAMAAGTTIYDNIPHPTPGNVPSQAFEAQSASEFGDQIQFAAGPRVARNVTVLMSSWGCVSGHWYSGDCATPSGSTFNHAITVRFYMVGTGGAVGSLLGSKTQTFAIPYRPSASASCTGADAGKWSNGTNCFNGYATPITFDVSSLALTLPNKVIVSVAYNTSDYGDNPIGSAPCQSSSGGCGYDSLNVGLADPATNNSVGSNPAPSDAYLSSTYGGAYCDGGAGGTGTFRLDAGCWTGFKPAIAVTASYPVAGSKDDCKGNGWATLSRADGSAFKNQGDCIQYVNTGK